MNTALYVISLIARSIIGTVVLFKHGWKAFGLMWLYALICAVTELPEGFV